MDFLILKLTTSIAGVDDVEVRSEASVVYNDLSFDHEFGTERLGQYEVESIDPMEVDLSQLREAILITLAETKGLRNRNRKFKKQARRLMKRVLQYLDETDPNTFWLADIIEEAEANYEPSSRED